jgi:hypothetical protein
MHRTTTIVLCVLILAACAPAAPEPTATPPPPTETATQPLAPTETPTATATETAASSPTPEATATEAASAADATPTDLPPLMQATIIAATTTQEAAILYQQQTADMQATIDSYTATPTPTNTATHTATFTPSITPTPTNTPIPPEDLPLRARFNYEVNGRTLNLTNLTEGRIDAWFWDFGDGNTSTERTPLHRYSASGRHVIRLTAWESDRSSTVMRAIDFEMPTCVMRPRGRASMHVEPRSNSQIVYYLVGEHEPVAVRAISNDAGELWYLMDFGGTSWVRASQLTVVSGTCPEPD